ncbi:hypothetical protein BDZ89DRAFT_1155579 [Hymenopellis radicata]|nr:hypothetical protein BDZ89DRAFT_1155579 [Hymenopellis radicata]
MSSPSQSSPDLLFPELPPLLPQGRQPSGGATSAKPNHIAHPYARLYARQDSGKRRKIWNHVLEKSVFNAFELSTLGAPHRRTIYTASLEAHIDRLHTQLLSLGYWPVAFEELEPFKGLNSKTAKSMVSGLQYDTSQVNLKLLELERAATGTSQTLGKKSVSP